MAERNSGAGQSRSKGGSRSDSGTSRSKGRGSRSNSHNKIDPADLARAAVNTVAQFTGRRPESILGVQRDGDGWRVTVEVVEMTRVPQSTDLLGSYVVSLDDQGEVLGYERRRRYQRGEVGGEEG